MTILPLLVVLAADAAAPAAAAPAQAPVAAPAMKAGIDQKCLVAKSADGKDGAALVALGELDQVRADPKAALAKFQQAGKLGYDVANAPINFTLVKNVVWIQTEECPVPVPAASAADLSAASLPSDTTPGPKVDYPVFISRLVHSEGNVSPRVWIGDDGKARRIAILEATSGPPGFSHNEQRKLGEEGGERLLARVQFALTALDALRSYDFGVANAGKVWERKIEFMPRENLGPAGGPDTSALPASTPVNPGLGR